MKVQMHDQDGAPHVYHVAGAVAPMDAIRDAWRQHRHADVDGELPPPWAQAHILIPRVHRGSHDRVYGGDPNLVHIPDGQRRAVGERMARALTLDMHAGAESEPIGKALCPGCYMIAGLNMLLDLARENGQSVRELAHTMAHAFEKLAASDDYVVTEEIAVMVDPPAELDQIHYCPGG